MSWWKERLFKHGLGSRFVLAIMLVSALIGAALWSLVNTPESEHTPVLVGGLIGLASAAVQHYFNSRATNGQAPPKEG